MNNKLALYIVACLTIASVLAGEVTQGRQLSDAVPPAETQDCLQAVSLGCNYQAWKATFGITYPTTQSDDQHHLCYCQNCYFIRSNNNNGTGYTLQEREDAAMCLQELNDYRGLRTIQRPTQTEAEAQRVQASLDSKVGVVTIPASLDYTNYNGQDYLTSVKNQGTCGCCWSFAATGHYESMLKLKGFNYDLSAEAALQCTNYYAPNGRKSDCSGGYFPDPLYFLSKVGSVPLSTYPYIAGNFGSGSGYPTTPGICTDQNRIYLGAGTPQLNPSTTMTATQIKTLLVTVGPIMVGVYANTGFSYYSSGTYSGCPAGSASSINHAVLLYGWDSSGNWLIRNQWGTSWGNGGNMVLSSTYDCGMNSLQGWVDIPVTNSNVQVVMSTGVSWQPRLAGMVMLALLLLVFLF